MSFFIKSGLWREELFGKKGELDLNNLIKSISPNIILTTIGSSGAATYSGGVLNIPIYSGGGGAVSSVFTRTGDVVAQLGDYTISQIGGLGTGVATALSVNVGNTGAFAVNGGLLINGTSAVTQTAGNNSSLVATTAYVDALTTLASGNIVVGNVSNVATGVTLTGDASITNAGVITVNKILGNTIPANASGVLTNNGSGTLSWGTSAAWALTGTSTLTGNTTITGSVNLDFTNARTTWGSTYTATANNDAMYKWSGQFTARSTISDNFYYNRIIPTGTTGSTGQNFVGLYIDAPVITATGGAIGTNYTFQAKGTSGDFIVNSTGAPSSGRGLTFTSGGSAGANVLDFATGSGAQITATSGSANELTFVGGTSNQTGALTRYLFSHTFAPVSGSTSTNLLNLQQTINQTGSANGATGNVQISTTPTAMVGNHTMLSFITSSGITLSNTFIGIDYNPTVTSITTHLAARFQSGSIIIGGTTLTTSAILDLQSTTLAFIPPRMTTTQKNAISSPSNGMIVFDTTLGKLCVWSTTWQTITSA